MLWIAQNTYALTPPARNPRRTISALLLLSSGSNVLCSALVVETCQDLQDAFDSTATEAVEVEIDPSKAITCDAFTTMSMDSNTLTVVPCETCATGGTVELNEVRFEVTGGAKLFWQLGAAFTGTDLQDVDGGAVNTLFLLFLRAA